jgi:hypothetical protein
MSVFGSLSRNPPRRIHGRYRLDMRRQTINLLAVIAIAGVLTGCAAPAAEPVSEPVPMPTPTPTATFDPFAIPENRFGLDCDSVLSDADISGLYGQSLALNPSNHWGARWTEALIADGALDCRWGDGPYLDDEATSIEIVANSRDGVTVDDFSSLVMSNPDFIPTPMSGVGDEAWVWCSGSADASSCRWSIAVDDLWISLSFLRAPTSEVDQTLDAYDSVIQTPREGSASQLLAARVAGELSGAARGPLPPARGNLSTCDSVVDWGAVADSLGLPLQSVSSAEGQQWTFTPLAVEQQLGVASAARQSARSCSAEFGDYSNDSRPTYVFLIAVPGGEWIESSGLWPAWRAEDCHGFEGGPVCELSSVTDSAAVTLRVSGGVYVGVPAIVMRAFQG